MVLVRGVEPEPEALRLRLSILGWVGGGHTLFFKYSREGMICVRLSGVRCG